MEAEYDGTDDILNDLMGDDDDPVEDIEQLGVLENAADDDVIENEVNESYDIVEYIEEDFEETNVEYNDDMGTHILKQEEDDDGAETYFCLQCDTHFASVEDFIQLHGGNDVQVSTEGDEDVEANVVTEQQWEVLDVEEQEEEEAASSSSINIKFKPIDNREQLTPKEQYIKAESAEEQSNMDAENYLEEETSADAELYMKQEANDASELEENKFYCCECQRVFDDANMAEEHNCLSTSIKDKTEEPPIITRYLCAHCNTMFLKFDDLKHHKEICNPKSHVNVVTSQQHHCKICNKTFTNTRSFTIHNRIHNNTATSKAMRQQPKASQEQEPCICKICNTTFAAPKSLKFHMKIHNKHPPKSIQEVLPEFLKTQYNELNQFYCEICNKSFEQNLLVAHKNMHQNIEVHSCNICNRQFENLLSFEVHMQLHADRPQKRRAAKVNSKPRAPSDKLKFPCQYCGHEFSRPHEKVQHERIHTGEKPYACEVCGKTFRVSYSLTLHLRTHTDIRPYICATCNKRFKAHGVYVHHLKTHQKERAYKCDLCEKAFRTSVQLCSHKNSHLKPYNCPECNRPFASMYAVKIHLKTHSKANKANENLKHRCSICGAVYARVLALRYHLRDQHAVDINDAMQIQNNASTLDVNIGEVEAEADSDENAEIDEDTAAIIMAAATASNCVDDTRQQRDLTAETILPDDIIVDNFHSEEIVTDWLSK